MNAPLRADDAAPAAAPATAASMHRPDDPPPLVAAAPRLSDARATLVHDIEVVDETGARRTLPIPTERPLTLYVDRREIVTLMTLGVAPEWLAIGYLLNQRLVDRLERIESVTVDWDVDAAAVATRAIAGDDAAPDLDARTARRIVTTGCGQGTVFGSLLDALDDVRLPQPQRARIAQATLHRILDAVRRQPSIHRLAGSVHGCALFDGDARRLVFIEDVGRHNAIDTIAGWMALHGVAGGDKIFYTTGRLTSEMVMKAAQMGIPIIVSRNGVTAMGHATASRLGMTLFGRAFNRHFLCYCGAERFDAEPDAPAHAAPVRVVAG